jgi:hypothetical protein
MGGIKEYLTGFLACSALLIGGAFIEHRFQPIQKLEFFKSFPKIETISPNNIRRLEEINFSEEDTPKNTRKTDYEIDVTDVDITLRNENCQIKAKCNGQSYETGVYTTKENGEKQTRAYLRVVEEPQKKVKE